MKKQLASMDAHSMPGSGGTLLDAFRNVRLLLETCASAWGPPGTGIRVLRLVNKDLSVLAIKAAHTCTLELGEGALPKPHKVARLMSDAELQEVDVIIIIRAGEQ